MKHFFAKFGYYMAAFLVCFWIAALLAAIFSIPISFLCKESLLAERISLTAVSLICAFGFLFITAFFEGFRTRKVCFKTLIPIVLIVLVVHHLVSLYFDYAYTFCGPVGTLCETIYFGNYPAIGENELRLGWYPLWWDTVALVAFQILVYAPAVILGELCGVKARMIQNRKMKQRCKEKTGDR